MNTCFILVAAIISIVPTSQAYSYLDVVATAPSPNLQVKAGDKLTTTVQLDSSRASLPYLEVEALLMLKPPNQWTYYEILNPGITFTSTDSDVTVELEIPDYVPPDEYWIVFVVNNGGFSVVGVAPPENLPSGSTSNWGEYRFEVLEKDPPPSCVNATKPSDAGSSWTQHDACESDEYCSSPYGKCYKCAFCFQDNDAYDLNCPSKCGSSTLSVGDTLPDGSEEDSSGPAKNALVAGCPQYDSLVTNLNPLIFFDDNSTGSTPRIMSQRLSDKLDLLSDEVWKRSFPVGTVLHVKSGYEEYTDGSSLTLHHEGRAIDIGLWTIGDLTSYNWHVCANEGEYCSCNGIVSLGLFPSIYTVPRKTSTGFDCVKEIFGENKGQTGQKCYCSTGNGDQFYVGSESDLITLARIASSPSVGMDWLEIDTNETIHASVLSDVCKRPLDLVFLLDESGSIEEAKYGGEPGTFKNKMIAFVKQVVQQFTFGSSNEDSRIAVATFSNGARKHMELGQFNTESEIHTALDAIEHQGGPTHTSTGLNLVRTELLTTMANSTAYGARPLSEGIPRVLIVITDGASSSGYDPATEAGLVQDMNTKVFVLGVGQNVEVSELNDMASNPDTQYVYALKSFDQIVGVVTSVQSFSCDTAAVVNSGEQTATNVGQCEIKYFEPKCGVDGDTAVTVTATQGEVHVYTSTTTSFPGPHDNAFKDDSSDVEKSFVISRQSGDSGQLVIAIKGIQGNNSFELDTSRDIFNGITSYSIDLPENTTASKPTCKPSDWLCSYPTSSSNACCSSAGSGSTDFYCDNGVDIRDSGCCGYSNSTWTCLPAGQGTTVVIGPKLSTMVQVTEPGFNPTFAITSGNDEGLFDLDQTTGELILKKSLDYETTPVHTVRVTGSDDSFPCLSGYVDVVVNVTNVDDNKPVVVNITSLVPTTVIIFNPTWVPNGLPMELSASESLPIGTDIIQIITSDPDKNSLTFTLTALTRRRSVATGTPFGFNASKGTLYVAGTMDSAVQSLYKLALTISGTGGGLSTTLLMDVTVETAFCPDGLFSQDGTYPCSSVQNCESDEFESAPATASSDRDCAEIQDCILGVTWEEAGPTATSDRVCKDVTPCGNDEFEAAAPTLTSDTQCTSKQNCKADEYISTPATDTSDRVCSPLTNCQQNEYESVAPTTTSNRGCAPVTDCDYNTQYEDTAPTATSNRVCADLTVCEAPGVEYETVAKTTTSDRSCASVTACEATTEYETASYTTTSDRECAVTTTCEATEYETKAPTTTSNRECDDLTVCGADFEETTAPTTTSDRVCTQIDDCATNLCDAVHGTCVDGVRSYSCACSGGYSGKYCDCKTGVTYTQTGDSPCFTFSTCENDEYESTAPTTSSDRVCLPITECDGDEYEVTGPTTTSDRECAVYTECDLVGSSGSKQYQSKAPTTTSDRECTDVSTCESDEFISTPNTATTDVNCTKLATCDTNTQYESKAPTTTSNRECQDLTDCENTEYESSAPAFNKDRVCSTITTCENNEYETKAPTDTSDRVCETLSSCTATQYEETAPTTTSNRVCLDATVCENDQYEESVLTTTSDRACKNLTECTNAQYQSKAPSTTSDRECQNLRQCDGSEYEATAPTAFSNRVCNPMTDCKGTEYEDAAPTTTSDRSCKTLTDCTSTQFEKTAPTSTSDRVCEELSNCKSTEYVDVEATATSDRVCEEGSVCSSVEYESVAMTNTSDRTCTALTNCTALEYQDVAPTTTSNRGCQPLTNCESDEYESKAPTDTSNRECAEHSTCDASEYEETGPTSTSDRVCSPISNCNNGQYEESPQTASTDRKCTNLTVCQSDEFEEVANTATSDRTCTKVSDCESTEYISTAATRTSDVVCSDITSCNEPAEYEDTQPTATSNRVCLNTTKCEADEYETDAVTSTSDRKCQALTTCKQNEYEDEAATATSDRKCKAIKVCGSDEYRSTEATATSDAVCSPLTDCTIDEYESKVETKTSDRECSNITDCKNTEFQAVAPTKTSDRVCNASTVCSNSEYESVALTAVSNRECVAFTVCTNDQYESKEATGTSDRICSDLTDCTASEYISTERSSTSDRVCTAHTKCNTTTEYLATPGNLTHDSVCKTISECSNAQFESKAPDATSDRECTAVKDCAGNEYQTQAPTATTDRVCVAGTDCENYEYQLRAKTTTSDRVCVNITDCSDTQYESQAPSDTSDRQCTRYTKCNSTQYESVAMTPTSDRQCASQTVCGITEFQVSDATATTDRVCQEYTVCGTGFKEIVAPTLTSDRICEAIDFCVSNQCVPGRGTCVSATTGYSCNCTTPFSGTFCECDSSTYSQNPSGVGSPCPQYTVCLGTEYESVAPTTTSDRTCASLTVCLSGEYEKKAPTTTSNRVCEPLTKCQASDDLMEAVPPTSTSDRGCVPIDDCTASSCANGGVCVDNFPTPNSVTCNCSTAAGFHGPTCSCLDGSEYVKDGECTQISTCGPDQFESVEATTTSDTLCANVSTCSASEYEDVPAGPASDRSCKPVTECKSSEIVSVGPTATSDRVCVDKLTSNACPLNCQNGGVCIFTSNTTCDGSPVCDCGMPVASTCFYGDFCELSVTGCPGDSTSCAQPASSVISPTAADVCSTEPSQDLCPAHLKPPTVTPKDQDGVTITTTTSSTTTSSVTTTFETGDNAAAGADSSSTVANSLAALGAIAALVILIIAFLFIKRQQEAKELSEEPELNPLFAADVAGKPSTDHLVPFASGAFPPAALTSTGDKLWADFRRVNSFDHNYYGNALMKADNEALEDVYAIVGLMAPADSALDILRSVGEKFCAQEIAGDPASEPIIDDVVDFIESAMADVIMERAIDIASSRNIANMTITEIEEERIYHSIIDDYDPYCNHYLEPSEDGTRRFLREEAFYADIAQMDELQEALYSTADSEMRSSMQEALYTTADNDMTGGEQTYAMASNGQGAEADYALGSASNASSSELYSLASTIGKNPNMQDVDRDIYNMANAPDDEGDQERLYDTANNRERAVGGLDEDNQLYSMATNDQDNGNADDERTYGLADSEESTYALADNTEPTYGVRTNVSFKQSPTGYEDDERLYTTATGDDNAEDCSTAGTVREEATYEFATGTGVTLRGSMYDQGESEDGPGSELGEEAASGEYGKRPLAYGTSTSTLSSGTGLERAYNSLARREDFAEMAKEFEEIDMMQEGANIGIYGDELDPDDTIDEGGPENNGSDDDEYLAT